MSALCLYLFVCDLQVAWLLGCAMEAAFQCWNRGQQR